MLKSTDSILHKPIENKLNIQICPYAGNGKCSGHEVDVYQRKESQIMGLSVVNKL